MSRLDTDWDPNWDDDWQRQQHTLEQEIEQEHPHSPRQVVELYRHGFAEAKRHPSTDWPDVEAEVYQDYMSGAAEPGEPIEGSAMDWEEARSWAHRGWEAGRAREIYPRPPGPVVK